MFYETIDYWEDEAEARAAHAGACEEFPLHAHRLSVSECDDMETPMYELVYVAQTPEGADDGARTIKRWLARRGAAAEEAASK